MADRPTGGQRAGPPVDVLESNVAGRPLSANAATTHVLGNRRGISGGPVPSDDELLERSLALSGSYASDDGMVMINHSVGQAFTYSGDRFVGRCTKCTRALLMPAAGEPLSDVEAAVRFVALHDHGGLD
jgi:hypothetical protein